MSSPRRPGVPVLASLGLGLLLAAVVASAGLGLAVPRLSKEGAGPWSVAGLVALVLGGAASVWFASRILRALRLRWWPLAVPLVLLTCLVAVWTVGQGVAAALPAHPALGSRTPGDVGLRARTVAVPTGDGVVLAGWWVPARQGAAVVLLHGAGATRTAVLDHAAVLARHGYGVLLLDARGHGGSEGRGMDFGWYGERDIAAGVDFVSGRPGVDPRRVGLVGMSMGGEGALGAAGVDSRVRAVVAEGATHRVAADKAYLSHYGVRGRLQRGVDTVTYLVADLLSDAPRPGPLRDSVAAAQADGAPTPVLLVVAGEVETERLAAASLRRASPQAVETWTVPGAGHVQGLRTAPEEWEARVVGFLDAALGPPGRKE